MNLYLYMGCLPYCAHTKFWVDPQGHPPIPTQSLKILTPLFGANPLTPEHKSKAQSLLSFIGIRAVAVITRDIL